MADFTKDVIDELKDANKRLDVVVANTSKEVESGAKASEEKKATEAKENKRTILFEQMAAGIIQLNKSFLKSLKESAKAGLGIVIAAIAAPIIALVAFFKQLAAEFMFLKKLTGKGLKLLFKPLKGLFRALKAAFGTDLDNLAKAIKNTKLGAALTSFKNFFTRIGNFFNPKNYKIFDTVSDLVKGLGAKVKSVVTSVKNFLTPLKNFFTSVFGYAKNLATGAKTASGILQFAAKFGTFLGKIFLPITILMSAFDFITGFMAGYKEGGILGGLEGGLTKLFQGLIGMPLDLLKKGVAWILGVFGFDNAKKWLNSFSFSALIGDIIGGIFSMIKGAVDWVKLLFSDPVAALTKLFKAILGGYASLMDILFSPVKSAITWVMRLFGWDEAAAATEKFSIKGFIMGVFKTVKDWFVGLFKWGKKEGETEEGGWSLGKMIGGIFKKAKAWFLGLFSFGKGDSAGADPMSGLDEGFSISKMLGDVVKKIKDYFWKGDGTGILEFDLASALPDFDFSFKDMFSGISDMFSIDGILGGLGRKIQKMEFDFLGGSRLKKLFLKLFDPTKGTDPKKQPGAATGGTFQGTPNGLLVGELGPELIFPSGGVQVMNADRTAQMQASALRPGAGAGGGATVVNAPVTSVNNTSSNKTTTTTSFSHPSAILNTVNVAA